MALATTRAIPTGLPANSASIETTTTPAIANKTANIWDFEFIFINFIYFLFFLNLFLNKFFTLIVENGSLRMTQPSTQTKAVLEDMIEAVAEAEMRPSDWA